eukprot:3539285-Rhodomonas_salina.1
MRGLVRVVQNKPLAEKSSYYYAHNSVSPEGPKTLVGAQTIYNHKPLGQDEVSAGRERERVRRRKRGREGSEDMGSGGRFGREGLRRGDKGKEGAVKAGTWSESGGR